MAAELVPESEFGELLSRGVPFIDVRAEVEFAKGAFPTSVNLPILNSEERAAVGTTYKQQGQDAAIELGHRLVSGELKAARVDAWCDFARAHPDTHVYCWRGGMRSNLAGQWMREAGVEAPVIQGGFKALRRYLINETEAAAARPMLRIGGRTGCDKTSLLERLSGAVDLEAHANHRGSSFGRRASGVPTQMNFENALAIDLLRHRRAGHRQLLLEDESRRIGAVGIPLEFFNAMQQSPMAVVERPLAERVEVIRRDYIVGLYAEFCQLGGDDPFAAFSEHLLAALARLRKRLGMERYQRLDAMLRSALTAQQRGDDSEHSQWIRCLLEEYYDSQYDYQLRQFEQLVVFRGNWQEVLEWAQAQN